MSKAANILVVKIDGFIRKYYKNLLIKGTIYSLSLLLAFYLVLNFFEFIGRWDVLIRTLLFYSYIAFALVIVIRLLLIPLLKLWRLGKTISYEKAATIIGDYFPEVADKLINLLQLEKLSNNQYENMDLLVASIEQKTRELKPIPFQRAIDYKTNKQYLKFLIAPVLIIGGILLMSPSTITEPTNRLVKHQQFFEAPLPFNVHIVNDSLQAVQYDDFTLKIKLEGEEIPEQFFLITENNQIKMVKESPVAFYHRFIRLQQDAEFHLVSQDYTSQKFRIHVLPKPLLLDFSVDVNYPDYTGKSDEHLNNTGDLIIPEGTLLTWNFYTKNASNLSLVFQDEVLSKQNTASNAYTFMKQIFSSQPYRILLGNEFISHPDSMAYSISVIPDMYPFIDVQAVRDSVMSNYLFFEGVIRDDYGFRDLSFYYRNLTLEEDEDNRMAIDLAAGQNPQTFYHSVDIGSLQLSPGDELEYYFTVRDNDEINGYKAASTRKMFFRLPSLEEIEEESEQTNDKIKDDIQQAMDELLEIRKELDEVNQKLLNEEELSWESQQQISDLMQKQMDLKQKLNEMQQVSENKQMKENQFKELDPDILEKQQQLNELFEELMKNEEISKLFEEMQKLLEEADKEKINEMLQQFQDENLDLEEALDRNLELFKQMEFETKLDETIKELNELAEEQKELAEESENKDADKEQLAEKQEELNEKFDDVKEDLERLDDLNKDLEDPNDFDKMEDLQEEVSSKQDEASESLEKNEKGKASQSQKNASQKMQQMADQMRQMQQDMISEGMEEDFDSLRKILDNVMQLSFSEEELLQKVSNISNNDPYYPELARQQMDIMNDVDVVADSLFALSKRQIMLEPYVKEQVDDIYQQMSASIDLLEQRKTGEASAKQQMAMTSINNLALMLSETLDMIKKMMNQMGGGNCSCKSGKPKPGGQGQKMSDMKGLQQKLNEQLEQMKNGMQKGKQKGGQKNGMSEQLARMAAEQEAIRLQLEQYANQLEQDGQFGTSSELKRLMEQMEKTETELVNKILNNETLLRQQEILNQLLKSEEAELEREKDEKREANSVKNQKISNPLENLEYKKRRLNEVELLKTIPPSLSPFYKKKVNEYFFNFNDR